MELLCLNGQPVKKIVAIAVRIGMTGVSYSADARHTNALSAIIYLTYQSPMNNEKSSYEKTGIVPMKTGPVSRIKIFTVTEF